MKQNTNAVNYEEVEKRIEVREQTNEIDTPKGIVDFLEKKNGIFNFDFKNRYSVTELVNCQRKSYYKQLGFEQEELLADVTVERMWTTVRGDFLHQMTNAKLLRIQLLIFQQIVANLLLLKNHSFLNIVKILLQLQQSQ